MTVRRLKKLLAAVGGVALSYCLTATCEAAVLRFWPDTVTDTAGWQLFQYQSPGGSSPKMLSEKTAPNAGATGNNSVSTPGGLFVRTDYLVSLPAGYEAGYAQDTNYTTLTDASVVLSGLSANGAAQVANVPALGIDLVAQPLANGGTFTFKSYSPTAGGEQVLLTGTFSNASIIGVIGQTTGNQFKADVSYTGGLIYDSVAASLGVTGNQPIPGNASWDLKLSAPMAVQGSSIQDFTATIGQGGAFYAIPEPATIGIFAIGGIAMMLRRRR